MPPTAAISAAPTREPETLRQSVAAVAGGEAASRLATLAVFVILARLLTPRDFGLLAMITVISGFFAVVLELGFAQALIHFPEVTDELYSTAFLLNALAGAAVAGIVYLGAGPLAWFYGEAALAGMVELTSVIFILNPVSSIQAAMLQKERSFRAVAAVEMGAVLAGAAVALLLAWRGFGAWALAWNLVAIAAVRAVLYSVLARRPLRPRFALGEAAKLWLYGRYILLSSTFNYAAVNVDQLLIGKFLGPALLGAYRYAGQVVALPQNFIVRTLNTVILSWYSEKQAEPGTIKAAHLRIIESLTFYTMPAMMLAASLADCLVLGILGRRWEPMIDVIRFLALVEMVQVLGVINGPIFLSQGKTRQLLIINLLRVNVLIGVLAGLPFGLRGVLWGVLIARLVNFFPSIHFGVRLVGIRVLEVLRRIGRNVLIAAAASGAVLALKLTAAPDPESIQALLALAACGALLYAGFSYLFNRGVLMGSLRMISPGFSR